MLPMPMYTQQVKGNDPNHPGNSRTLYFKKHFIFITQSSVIIASPAAETAAEAADAGQTGPAPAPVSPRAPGAAAALDAAECERCDHQDHGNHNENNLICFQGHSQQFTDTRDGSVFAFCNSSAC